jgi:putative transcriptional regulator
MRTIVTAAVLGILGLGMATLAPGRVLDDRVLAPGRLLVASERLGDPNFAESVVLLLNYDESDGAMGVILNRPTPMGLDEVLPWFAEIEDRDDRLYFGGPVEIDTMVVLLRSPSEPRNSRPVLDSVWVTADQQVLRRVVEGGLGADDLRVFAGYSGWAPRQLEAELRSGAWRTLDAHQSEIFAPTPGALWRELIRRLTLPVA